MPRPRATDGAEPMLESPWLDAFRYAIEVMRHRPGRSLLPDPKPEPRKAQSFAEWQQAAAEAIEAAQRRRV